MENNKNNSSKQKLVLGSIFACFILIVIVSIFLLFTKNNSRSKTIIFRHSYINGAWGYSDYGYVIYDNGVIEEYSNSDTDEELKSAKINNNELNELLSLSKSVKNKYEKDTSGFILNDAGLITKEIYNENLEKWIILSKSGDTFGSNNTEESLKILELTSELHEKYLSDGYTSWMD